VGEIRGLGAATLLTPHSQQTLAGSKPKERGMKHCMAAIAVSLAMILTACTGSGGAPKTPPPTPASTSSTPSGTTTASSPTTGSPSATYDPKIKPAVDAYLAYNSAYLNALKNPSDRALRAPIARYAFDPAGEEATVALVQLANAGVIWRGTILGDSRISVLAAGINDKPYPKVTLTDCPTASNFAAYDAKTGKKLASVPGQAPPPYLTTATVILYRGHWGVQKATTDYKHSCTA
jgi:hypothetical protein